MKWKGLTGIFTAIAVCAGMVLNVHADYETDAVIPVKGDPGAVVTISGDSPLPDETSITIGKDGKGEFRIHYEAPDVYSYTISRTDKEGFSNYKSDVYVTNKDDDLSCTIIVTDEEGKKTDAPEFTTPKPSAESSEKPAVSDTQKTSVKKNAASSEKTSSKSKGSPDTGDQSQIGLSIVLFAGALIAVTGVSVMRKKLSD